MLQRNRSGIVAVGMLMVLGLATSVQAGPVFRLEIGHPIAGASFAKIKKAALMVRGLACDDPASITMAGTAEGFVNGARRSMPLQLVQTMPGVFAVPQPPTGRWVINLTGACPGRHATASAVVPLGGPSGFLRDKAEFYAAAARPAQVEASLNALVAGEQR
jgi:hypothetical protein